MRILLGCSSCKRQYDASDLPVGARFHCVCGTAVEVPAPRAADALVVRCSSCGGARSYGAEACAFCRADFTVHEQDLNTMCPSCMARIGDRARFCHHCGTRIAPQGRAGAPSASACPACPGQRLSHRQLGQPAVAFLECQRCAGLWLSQAVFDTLLGRARSEIDAVGAGAVADSTRRRRPAGSCRPLYRRCPACAQPMHRANYGRRSGVVVDSCAEHGVWLDAAELEAILDWVRRGGEARARRAAEEERQAATARERFAVRLPTSQPARADDGAGNGVSLDFLGELIDALR